MKSTRIFLTPATALCNLTALSSQVCAARDTHEATALVGATAINPGDGKMLRNATIVIAGDRIAQI